MTIVQELQKAKEEKGVLESAKELSDARDEIIYLFEKEIKIMHLKQKKKNQKKTSQKK